jgi:polysaccharide biosynthesis/export protein
MNRLRLFSSKTRSAVQTVVLFALCVTTSWAVDQHRSGAEASDAATSTEVGASATSAEPERLLQLGAGDSVAIQVYGQPDMNATVYVSDDGTIPVALAGAVQVRGLSPGEAAKAVEKALRKGKFLLDPHVTITIAQSRSQRVSVLGEVRTPGRYPVESDTTVFDLLAEAGGTTDKSADVVDIIRTASDGTVAKTSINLRESADALMARVLHSGDSIFVPVAEHFYIYGEVQQPNMYKVEEHMTVVQAIARAGGVTARGTDRRVEVKRRGSNGGYVVVSLKPTDLVQADDVLRVKESIF